MTKQKIKPFLFCPGCAILNNAARVEDNHHDNFTILLTTLNVGINVVASHGLLHVTVALPPDYKVGNPCWLCPLVARYVSSEFIMSPGYKVCNTALSVFPCYKVCKTMLIVIHCYKECKTCVDCVTWLQGIQKLCLLCPMFTRYARSMLIVSPGTRCARCVLIIFFGLVSVNSFNNTNTVIFGVPACLSLKPQWPNPSNWY